VQLPDKVVLEVRNLSAERVKSVLSELGIEDEAIGGLLDRLNEIQESGRILNSTWGGEIRGT